MKTYLINAIKNKPKESALYLMMALAYAFCVISFFNKPLAIGMFLFSFLTIVSVLFISKSGVGDRKLYTVFGVALLIHLCAVLFIYFTNFNPFGGGADYQGYNLTGIELASRFSHGNFSMAGLYTDHFFPILIGVLYLFTLPAMIVGQLFTVWLAAISVAVVYLLVLELCGTKRIAFLASCISIFYPSYLYFGSVLLKDTLVIPLVLLGLLLILKVSKKFSLINFAIFFALLTGLINLRFYVGYALLFSCIISWPLLSAIPIKKKILYWLAMIIVLGFPSFIVGNGYYGSGSFKTFFNAKEITYFREVVYGVNSPLNPKPKPPTVVAVAPTTTQTPATQKPNTENPPVKKPDSQKPIPVPQNSVPPAVDIGSTFVLETGFGKGPVVFIKNSSLSFIYSLLGPFPWQFNKQRQMVALAETIPWYIFIMVSLYGLGRFIKKNGIPKFLEYYKFALPLLVFGILATGALALYINNYGIIARIRIPMLICFVCVLCLSFNEKENYEKIPYYWGRGIYWLTSFKNALRKG